MKCSYNERSIKAKKYNVHFVPGRDHLTLKHSETKVEIKNNPFVSYLDSPFRYVQPR